MLRTSAKPIRLKSNDVNVSFCEHIGRTYLCYSSISLRRKLFSGKMIHSILMYQQLWFFSSNFTFILSGLSFAYNIKDKGRLICICTGHLDRRIENDVTRRLAAPEKRADQFKEKINRSGEYTLASIQSSFRKLFLDWLNVNYCQIFLNKEL